MKRWLVIFVVLLVCALLIVGCGAPPATPSTSPASPKPTTPTSVPVTTPSPTGPVYGGTLRFITSNVPGTPIGWVPETTGPSIDTMQLSLQLLLNEKSDGTFVPMLAASYDIVATGDSPSITFHLRKGVKFHDGSDFNAKAVKWAWEATKAGGMNKGTTDNWKSIDVIDDYTIRVNLDAWQNRIIRGFAGATTYVCSPAAYEKNGLDWIRWHMVGTGPFKQVDFQRDVSTKTVRNENYWETGKPYLDGVNYLYVPDEMTRVAMLKKGEVDVLDLYGNGRIASELKAAGYKIMTQQQGVTMLIPDSLNADSVWSNIKVRQAAEYAIDKELLAKTFGYGYSQAAYQLPSTTNSAYKANLSGTRKYDPEKAKQLLAEAGYSTGFDTQIIALNTVNRDVLTAIQSNLGKVGIKVDLQFVEAAKIAQYRTGTWKNALLYHELLESANYNHTFNMYFGDPSSWFKSMKKPDGWKALLTSSFTSLAADPALMQKCVQAISDDASLIPVSYLTAVWATTDKVHDTGIGERGITANWNPQNAWLSK